jgi:parallel beta-helix repeat protein
MSGGSITGNTAINNGGGVYIVSSSGGTFTMSGGSITSNDANTGFSGYVGDNLYIEHGNLDHIDWTAADIGGLYAGGLAKYGAVLKGWNSASDWSGTYYDARPGSGTCYPVWSGDPGFMWFDPIAITSLSELEEIGTYSATLGYDYILVNNITLGSTWTAIGDGTDPFTGNLDGRGHTITVPSGGTTITPQSAGLYDVAGLFGNINDPSALITDLTLAGGAFTAVPGSAGVVMGGIVGWMSDGTIQNCAVRININQNSPNAASGEIGGIAGYSAGIIQNCYSSGAIDVILPSSASSEIVWVGGIAGGNDGTIENCYSTGNISGSSYETSAGGIAGWHSSSVISYCYATGNVTGYSPGSTAGYYGGIVGQAVTTTMGIGNCVALNGNIATTDTIPNLGRVCGDSTFFPLADNYGRDDMQVNNTTGSWTSNATGIDGGDVSMGTATTEANTELWWRTLGPGPDWSFSAAGAGTPANPWEWGGNLPKLYWE